MYKDFFGFSEDPFSLTPDPAFLYMTMSHWEALSTMMGGIKERKGIIVITGDVGTGKTTLIHALLKDLNDQIRTAFIFNPQLTFKQLLKAILWELNVPVSGENTLTLLYKFDEYIREKSAADETVVILIDEAQSIGPKVLTDLDRLLQRDAAQAEVLQTLLVGQLELEGHLGSEELLQFKHRIAIHRRIRPLTEEESSGYIDHRLKKVGSGSSKVFTPKAIDLICKSAKGIPRVINLICDGALFAGYSNSRRKIDSTFVREVLVENDIIAEEPDVGTDETAQEEETFEGQEAAEQQEFLAKEQDTASPEIVAVEETQAEKEEIPEEKPVVERKEATGKEAIGDKESMNEKAAIREMDDLRPRDAEEPQPDGSFRKKIGVLAVVVSLLAALALFYWHESGRLSFKEEEAILPPAQDQMKKERPEDIPKKDEWEGINVKAEAGWTLSFLANRYYGSTNPTFVDLILEANPQITDLNLIQLKQSIKIPRIKEDLFIIRATPQTFKIHLATIADQREVRIFQDEPLLVGKKLEILPRKVSSRETWYRIFAGEFESKDEAIKTIQTMREKDLLPAFPRMKKKS
jgi:general secretion pathway protein A